MLFVGAFNFSHGTEERFLHWAGIRRVGRFVDSALLRENMFRTAFGFLLLPVIHIIEIGVKNFLSPYFAVHIFNIGH